MEGARGRKTGGPPAEAGGMSDAAWAAVHAALAAGPGELQPVGADHAAVFVEAGPVLLVVFHCLSAADAGADPQLPFSELARAEGWSHLTLLARGATWFRDPAVWSWFDRQLDAGFFEEFDRVVFYGAGMGGYAAAAFSVCAPGATVLAVRPQATLDPRMAEWDRRYPQARRLDFATRYGYGPAMAEAAAAVFVLYDPEQAGDAMHAALYARPHVTRLRCRHMGARLEAALAESGLTEAALRRAGHGALDGAVLNRLWRAARRGHAPYIYRLIGRLAAAERPALIARLARWALARRGED